MRSEVLDMISKAEKDLEDTTARLKSLTDQPLDAHVFYNLAIRGFRDEEDRLRDKLKTLKEELVLTINRDEEITIAVAGTDLTVIISWRGRHLEATIMDGKGFWSQGEGVNV